MDVITLKPIGFVRHSYSDEEVKASPDGVDGYIELLPEYAEGTLGLEGFSHIIIVAYLHKHRGAPLRVRHRRLLRYGLKLEELPEVGVFASNSPDRPNPIAVTIVRLNGVRGATLEVSGLDLYNGTPVLDIKPYTPSRSIRDVRVPEWFRRLQERAGVEP